MLRGMYESKAHLETRLAWLFNSFGCVKIREVMEKAFEMPYVTEEEFDEMKRTCACSGMC